MCRVNTYKQKAYKFGIWTEYLAILYFFFKGYKLLHHRYKSKVGEIDLIFSRKKHILFVEVKGRNFNNDSQFCLYDVVTNKQVHRICQSAEHFFHSYKKTYETMQIDVFVFIKPRLKIILFENITTY